MDVKFKILATYAQIISYWQLYWYNSGDKTNLF